MINKIHKMDCLDGIKLLGGGTVKAIITDPPYFCGMTHDGSHPQTADLEICRPFFIELLKEFDRVLTDDGVVYWFCDWRSYPWYYGCFQQTLSVNNMIVWSKIGVGPGMFNYRANHELIIFFAKKNLRTINQSNVISEKRCPQNKKIHPTQKPLNLIEKLIIDSTQEGDIVLDCFMGSGTTAVAALNTNRKFIGFEIQEKYVDIANQRIKVECEMKLL